MRLQAPYPVSRYRSLPLPWADQVEYPCDHDVRSVVECGQCDGSLGSLRLAVGAQGTGDRALTQWATPAERLTIFGCRSDLHQPRPGVPRPLQQAPDDRYADILAADAIDQHSRPKTGAQRHDRSSIAGVADLDPALPAPMPGPPGHGTTTDTGLREYGGAQPTGGPHHQYSMAWFAVAHHDAEAATYAVYRDITGPALSSDRSHG